MNGPSLMDMDVRNTLTQLCMLVCLCAIPSIIQAQKPQPLIDSLLIVLQTAQQDTNKVKTLNALAVQYRIAGQPAKSRSYADTSLALATPLGFKKGMAKVCDILGLLEMDAGAHSAALSQYQTAVVLFEEAGDLVGLSNVLSNIGTTYRRQSNNQDALKYYHRALETGEKSGDKTVQLIINNNIGSVYGAQGNYPEALRYFLNTLGLARALNRKYVAGVCLSNIAAVYSYQKQPAEARKYAEESLQVMEEVGHKEGLATANDLLGSIEEREGQHASALVYMSSALTLYKELNRKGKVAEVTNHLGSTYLGMGDYENALLHFHEALELRKELDDKEGIGESYEGIGSVLMKQAESLAAGDAHAKLRTAIDYFKQTLQLAQEVGYTEGVKGAFRNLSEAYTALQDYENAFAYQQKYIALRDSLVNNETTRQLEQLRTQYEVDKAIAEEKVQQEKLLAEQKYLSEKEQTEIQARHDIAIAEAKAQEEKAVAIAKVKYEFALAKTKTDQEKQLAEQQFQAELKLAERNAQHQIALAEEKANQERKEAETKAKAEEEKADRKRVTGMILSGVGLLAIISLFIILYLRQRNQKRKAIERAETIHKMAELELQSLRAQLNPHFMFNSLNAIQELILMEDNDNSHKYLARFAKLLRMLLENANSPFIPLARELEFLQLYLSLENLRIPDLKYSIQIDPKINTEHIKIPNMILQPYIENAIWHGLSHKTQGERNISIRVSLNAIGVRYEIEDNGVGRTKSAELKSHYRKEHKSRGMELLTKRFRLLSEEFKHKIETQITDLTLNEESNGTRVSIIVPNEITSDLKVSA